ncbi:FAD-dependent monooxygenase [Saccharopolyspora gloriosae]|uniref:2-polyprenyl-6-methoxyphenol hydroxylase-like FAD-dependent oxidoreductase n=1 Tax=Saccharopolyspora gloriosae TaxID=455344 RepID=A0A840NHZ0_9PSEU|nr:FAD-dependent monooxygenase [Saccharopolyspora gloriosae]MBB5068792.1 2-polyprenyl-6-methoxyphenol hydroxylase-like FAD-dependent oxidoreductase [Saccharopolyspora gloriosae]
MKITCVGAGPAGLYFAISAKLRDAGHDITVIERDPPGATYGWGVVYWDNLLDPLYANDAESAQQIRSASTLWQEQQIVLGGSDVGFLGGYGFSVNRSTLLDVLAERATDLGVNIRYEHGVDDLSELADSDLIIGSDGANSKVRSLHEAEFGTRVETGNNPYIWLGTDMVFDRFTFAFEQTSAGWIWFHAYPSSAGISTCIVECTEQTWKALGFDSRDNEDTVRLLEKIFAAPLDGHSLISQSRGQPARWQRFTQVLNRTWLHDNVMLLGDAAHTTHFTIGSGTRLAIMDAVILAQKLHDHEHLDTALRDFDQQGRAALRPLQAAGRTSMAWFERADRYLDRNAADVAYAMAARHGYQPPWQYRVHQASQVSAVRKGLRWYDNGQRWYLACRRGEALGSRADKATTR